MLDLCDEDFDEMELVEGALALNKAIDASTNVEWAKLELKRLLDEAELHLIRETNEEQRLDSFLRLFYTEWGFHGDQEAYFHSSNAFIDQVLEKRKGIPLSLGTLLLYFGNHLGFSFMPVTFPTQFLIQVSSHDHPVRYINPFSGEFVSQHILKAWLIGQQGSYARLKPEHLKVSDHPTIIGRWLALLKGALMREEHYALALKCTNIALGFVPDDPYEIRDRGFIYQQLECPQVAAIDYQYFIEQCPDDPAAELLKSQVSALESTRVTLH
ncbi:SirB1 family protein [Vibrio sp.]|uniref:Protein SirB1 N-terminal domain-containing protein n=1 Tax=Vibrio viridaestus TaxID=2487322 RepID=A0A3N9TKF7_9VIBR|nr:SirB1 family protein [Vibrio viridaestus]MDC0611097.1 SirB1 family protein [Vibrio sp.]RQW64055.1 hypothetical protein EES38_05545 [Vibrio viridaestus]